MYAYGLALVSTQTSVDGEALQGVYESTGEPAFWRNWKTHHHTICEGALASTGFRFPCVLLEMSATDDSLFLEDD